MLRNNSKNPSNISTFVIYLCDFTISVINISWYNYLCSDFWFPTYSPGDVAGSEYGDLEGIDVSELTRCPFCEKPLGPNTSVKRHIAAVHLKIKNHECAICAKKFFRKNDRDRHMLRHIGKPKKIKNILDKMSQQWSSEDWVYINVFILNLQTTELIGRFARNCCCNWHWRKSSLIFILGY